jgi:hypothetical protein
MATISNISLLISNASVANTRNVTVSGTMNFDAGEVGKSYRLEIRIFGEDKPGDNLPSADLPGDDELYTYSWGSFFNKRPYRQFTVPAAGPQAFTETRAISSDTLDEDKGEVAIGPQPGLGSPPPTFPRRDEVYATVLLSGAPVSARSATVIAGIGV